MSSFWINFVPFKKCYYLLFKFYNGCSSQLNNHRNGTLHLRPKVLNGLINFKSGFH